MKIMILIFSCLFLLAATFSAMAAEAKDIGFINNVSGHAFISRAQLMIPAKANNKLFASDNLITGDNGSLGVILQDNSVLSLGPKSRASKNIVVVGHTDAIGLDWYNEKLSLKRAGSVTYILVEKGVPRESIEVTSFGKKYPLVKRPNGVAEPKIVGWK